MTSLCNPYVVTIRSTSSPLPPPPFLSSSSLYFFSLSSIYHELFSLINQPYLNKTAACVRHPLQLTTRSTPSRPKTTAEGFTRICASGFLRLCVDGLIFYFILFFLFILSYFILELLPALT